MVGNGVFVEVVVGNGVVLDAESGSRVVSDVGLVVVDELDWTVVWPVFGLMVVVETCFVGSEMFNSIVVAGVVARNVVDLSGGIVVDTTGAGLEGGDGNVVMSVVATEEVVVELVVTSVVAAEEVVVELGNSRQFESLYGNWQRPRASQSGSAEGQTKFFHCVSAEPGQH